MVGRQSSTRKRKSTAKVQIVDYATANIQAVGIDPNHSTDEQARNSPLAAEWAEARAKERAQMRKYGVFTKVDNLL